MVAPYLRLDESIYNGGKRRDLPKRIKRSLETVSLLKHRHCLLVKGSVFVHRTSTYTLNGPVCLKTGRFDYTLRGVRRYGGSMNKYILNESRIIK